MAPSGRRLRMLCLLAVAVGLSTGPARSPAPAEGQGGGEHSRSVHADEPGSGTIAGVVLDLEGKPVPAALVVVCDDETGIPKR